MLIIRFKQFSGEMILVLLAHIFITIFDRFLYLKDFSGTIKRHEEIHEQKYPSPFPISEEKEEESSEENEQTKQELQKQKLQRYLKDCYPDYNYGLLFKYILQWIMLLGISYIIFWYFPNSGNMKLSGKYLCQADIPDCNDATANPWIAIFYLIFCVYFALSALQIRNGWPEIRNIKTLRKKVGLFNYFFVKLYLSMPFLVELQNIMDWCFTKHH